MAAGHLKELVDNALDACEEAGIAPEIDVQVEPGAITVIDNGPGMPSETVTDILDFSSRVSSREAYVAPDRGAQGNALKTILAMPFVLDGAAGHVEIRAHGLCHRIAFTVDALRQAPVIDHRHEQCDVRNGTSITVAWPEFSWLNPGRGGAAILTNRRRLHLAQPASRPHRHLVRRALRRARDRSLLAQVAAVRSHLPALVHARASRAPDRRLPDPRYGARLASAPSASSSQSSAGLSGSLKQKAVLQATGLQRAPLASLCDGRRSIAPPSTRLLDAMVAHTRPVKPEALGIIGRDHLHARLEAIGCEMASFQYKQVRRTDFRLPWVVEAAFAWCPELTGRRLITGVNWSPGILNPFRALGPWRQSLDTLLSQQRADRDEPVVVLLHLACPRVEYTDRGKSAVVVAR